MKCLIIFILSFSVVGCASRPTVVNLGTSAVNTCVPNRDGYDICLALTTQNGILQQIANSLISPAR